MIILERQKKIRVTYGEEVTRGVVLILWSCRGQNDRVYGYLDNLRELANNLGKEKVKHSSRE